MKSILVSILAAAAISALSQDFISYSFTWDKNKESNLAGYKVRWGYTNSPTGWIKVVNTNFVTVAFSNSIPHWLNVSAYNSDGFESLPSSNLIVDLPSIPANGRAISGTVISTTITNWIVVP